MQSLIVAGVQLVAGVVLPPLPAPPVHTVLASVPTTALVEPVKRPDYEKEVLTVFREKRDAAQAQVKTGCDAIGGTVDNDGFECVPPPPPPPEPLAPVPAPEPVVLSQPELQYGGGSATASPAAQPVAGEFLTGAYGYALAGGNCVNTAKAWGKNQPGNPISWVPTTSTPFIGAAALFPYNHVAVVVGLWSNGDIEVAQENCPACPHRYPRGAFRGFF
jgi:hypothetical protein